MSGLNYKTFKNLQERLMNEIYKGKEAEYLLDLVV